MRMPYIHLRSDSSTPLYTQIAEQIVEAIRRRTLKFGERLPGVRELAQYAHVSMETVQRAYHQLQSDGWVESKSRRGTVVTANVTSAPIPLPQPAAERHARFIHALREHANRNGVIPVSGGVSLIGQDWMKFLKSTAGYAVECATERESFHPFGVMELREKLQGRLTEFGVFADVAQICIVSGTQQALNLIAAMEVTPGSVVFVPEMCYLAAEEIFRDHATSVRTLPISHQGIDLEPLEIALKTESVSLAYLMPNGHYPTGWSCSLRQKQRLIHLAETYGFAIVEDDYYADFFYTDKPPVTLLSLASESTEIYYLATFSHLTHPGLRLGLMVTPQSRIEQMERRKFLADGHTSTVTQYMLYSLLQAAWFETSLSSIRTVYRRRRDEALEICARWLPDTCVYQRPDCGFSMWVATKEKLGFSFFYQCLEENVLVMPDEAFALTDTHAGFQINFTANDAQVLEEGMRRISLVLRRLPFTCTSHSRSLC